MVLLVIEEIHPHHDALEHGQNRHDQSSLNSTMARATPAVTSYRRPSIRLQFLHPEHAEFRLFNRRIQRRRQAEAEHHAGIDRIDYAIVPQSGAGIVRMSLECICPCVRPRMSTVPGHFPISDQTDSACSRRAS